MAARTTTVSSRPWRDTDGHVGAPVGVTMSVGTVPFGLLVATLVLASACLVGKRPVTLPPDNGVATVILASMTLNEPLEKLARHPWFAVREKGAESWVRWEIWSPGGGGDWGYVAQRHVPPLSGPDVRVHGILRGERATRFSACLRRESARYEHRHFYLPWPGPNSNTYVDTMLRRCGFRAELPATSVGKDYRGLIGVSWTSGGTGVQLETPLVGIRLGLTEGIQLHLFGLAIGIDFWPPALVYPLGNGRLGFDDR